MMPEKPFTPTALQGKNGEDAAAEFLLSLGWKILGRNLRFKHLELDIVAKDAKTIVFVEVKTREWKGMQKPYEALDSAKKNKLVRAATAWLSANDAWSFPCRFDLVSVIQTPKGEYQTELVRNVIEFKQYGNTHNSRYAAWQPW